MMPEDNTPANPELAKKAQPPPLPPFPPHMKQRALTSPVGVAPMLAARTDAANGEASRDGDNTNNVLYRNSINVTTTTTTPRSATTQQPSDSSPIISPRSRQFSIPLAAEQQNAATAAANNNNNKTVPIAADGDVGSSTRKKTAFSLSKNEKKQLNQQPVSPPGPVESSRTPRKGALWKAMKKKKRMFGGKVHKEIPWFLVEIVNVLEARALDIEGIFRISGRKTQVEELQVRIEKAEPINFDEVCRTQSPHVLTGIIKTYFRSLKTPIIPFDQYKLFVSVGELPDPENRCKCLKSAFRFLPAKNLNLLKFIILFLHRVAQRNEKNKMSAANLAVVMAPNLLWAKNETSESFLADSKPVNIMITTMINHAPHFFEGQPLKIETTSDGGAASAIKDIIAADSAESAESHVKRLSLMLRGSGSGSANDQEGAEVLKALESLRDEIEVHDIKSAASSASENNDDLSDDNLSNSECGYDGLPKVAQIPFLKNEEVLLHTFSFLSPSDQMRTVALASKLWNALSWKCLYSLAHPNFVPSGASAPRNAKSTVDYKHLVLKERHKYTREYQFGVQHFTHIIRSNKPEELAYNTDMLHVLRDAIDKLINASSAAATATTTTTTPRTTTTTTATSK